MAEAIWPLMVFMLALLSLVDGLQMSRKVIAPCPSRFSVLQAADAFWKAQCQSYFFKSMMKEIRAHECYVEDPKDAALLFVDFDTLRQCEYPFYKPQCTPAEQAELQLSGATTLAPTLAAGDVAENYTCHWGSPLAVQAFKDTLQQFSEHAKDDKDHVAVFFPNVNKWAGPRVDVISIKESQLPFPVRFVGLDLYQSWIDRKRDINLLMPLLYNKVKLSTGIPQDRKACSPRPVLASFFGGKVPGSPRERLIQLHDPSSGIIVQVYEKDHAQHNFNESSRLMFNNLLWNSTFGLAPAGDNHYSFRLTEVLAAGSIPVVLDDEWTPPFGNADISEWGVRIPERDIPRTPDILRSFSEQDICKMQKAGQLILDKARDIKGMVNGMVHGLWEST